MTHQHWYTYVFMFLALIAFIGGGGTHARKENLAGIVYSLTICGFWCFLIYVNWV